MNRLSTAERAKVINCLIEGCSLRSTVRLTGVAKKTVSRILVETGEACAAYHDKIMRNLSCKVIQVDEVWSFNWSDLKSKLSQNEGFTQLSDKIGQLKMPGKDGKMYDAECGNTETIFRIIQSIPSPKAEVFKQWLAKVGYERIQEHQNPSIAIKRAIVDYQLQGRKMDWIEARLRTIVSRKDPAGIKFKRLLSFPRFGVTWIASKIFHSTLVSGSNLIAARSGWGSKSIHRFGSWCCRAISTSKAAQIQS